MINLPIHLTTHHLHLSDSLRDFVRKKLMPVKRFANDALAADVVLRRHNGAEPRFSASARLALPGRDVYGRAVHVDLYVAIDKLVARLARRLRTRKTRLGRALERQPQAATGPAPIEQPAGEPTTASSGSKRKPPSREGGQEMRVFPFRRGLVRADETRFVPTHSSFPKTKP